MPPISIKAMIDAHAAASPKIWAHDRSTTVGASEAFQCERKIHFAKTDTPPDPDYVDRYGAKLRGDLIENHLWVPAIRSQKPDGVAFLYAGDEQRTLVDGYLSATSDGLLVGVSPDALAHHGIADCGTELVVEAKSIDPRATLRDAKVEHIGQVQVQLGLFRACTNHKPDYALISYVDASSVDEIHEFAVPFDPAVYQAARDRARRIMTADAATELRPEGKIAGGRECSLCPFRSRCADAAVATIPTADAPLTDAQVAEVEAAARAVDMAENSAAAAEQARNEARERLKETLRRFGARKVGGPWGAVSWSSVKGRTTTDSKALAAAARAAGIDITAFQKVGDPSERLTITLL